MTVLAFIDYAFIIVFFAGLLGMLVLISIPHTAAAGSEAQALPPVRENKLAYGFLAALLVLLFVLSLVSQREQAHAGS